MNPQLEELATLYVLDRLDPAERTAFESQLPGSPELTAFVRDLEAALAREIRSLPQHQPSADLLARIESRLDPAPAVVPSAGAAPARPAALPWLAFARWGIAALITVSLATLAVQSLRQPPAAAPVVLIVGLGSHASTLTELPLPAAPKNAESSFVQLAALAEKYWDHPAQFPLTPAPASPSARSYALFDPASRQGFIAIRQLPALPPDQRYYLWVVDTSSGRVTEAGALPASETTSGLYSFSVATPNAARPATLNFFVTAEENSPAKPPKPRGQVVLGNHRI